MLLDLPTVTLLGIDCVEPGRLLRAMRQSSMFVRFGDRVLVTGQALKESHGIRVVRQKQGGRLDYEVAAATQGHRLTSTSHVLHMEWDSLVANWQAWNQGWLEYDYIGAPWPEHYQNGWPVCTSANCVGNAGFSLRSRRLYELCERAYHELEDHEGIRVHDAWICRTLRPWLEREGIRFAPPEVAARFSCENQVYSGQFGLHGVSTFVLNGIKLPKDCDGN